jgi:hypothetical protein
MCVRARLADDEWTLCSVCRRPLRAAECGVLMDGLDTSPTHASCLDGRRVAASADAPGSDDHVTLAANRQSVGV